MTTPLPDELDELIDFIFTDMNRVSGTPVHSSLRKKLTQAIQAYADRARQQTEMNTLYQLKTDYMQHQLGTPANEWVPFTDFIDRRLAALNERIKGE